METSKADLAREELFRLKRKLLEMPMRMLYAIADENEVEIPFEAMDNYQVLNSLLDDLSLEAKKQILSEYGDAGRASSYVFASGEKTPSIQTILEKSKALSEGEHASTFWEHYPYIERIEHDHRTGTLRIRFHYYLGSIALIDESTGRPKEHRRYWRGVVVYRPSSKLLEIRAPHRSMARKMSARIPAQVGLAPFVSVNLMDEEMNKGFIHWISSLNSATIELYSGADAHASVIITAKRGMDLRTAKKYHEELKHGKLRHGHVTIEPEEGHNINFHIYFRDCHIKYTLFSSEADMEYVMSALEKMCEGYRFAKPERTLKEYFDKES